VNARRQDLDPARLLRARRTRSRGASAPNGSRRGAVLVLFTLFILAFFGLVATFVDLGIVRVTQAQMQSSADVAALEGLAGRDAIPGDPAASDAQRRAAAAFLAAAVFDDDLDPATIPAEFLLGAGPTLSTGVGGIAEPAGGVLTTDGPWLPTLQSNAATNAAYGDLVAGSYAPLDPTAPGRTDWHDEASDYSRLDFAAAPAGASFLARLRRTREGAALDRIPGESSAGPTLPYLFGLGSGALSAPTPDVYDPRRDGVTVRATAIADARPVTRAGLARPGLPGLAPVGNDVAAPGVVRWLSLDAASWLALPEGAAYALTVRADGTVDGSMTGFAAGGDARLGGLLVEGPLALPPVAPAELGGLVYATVHERAAPTDPAFVRGFIALTVDTVTPGAELQLTGVRLGATIAPRNASAQRRLAASPAAPLLPGAVGAGLLAPTLAR